MPDVSQGLLERSSHWLGQRAHWWLVLITTFFIYDIVLDVLAGEVDSHLVVELTIFVICTVVLAAEWRRNSRLHGKLVEARAANERLSGQFADYVREQLARWALSPSEREIAWLMLKGYAFGEIAVLRSVQEKTVRQQATAIYAKSGARNRNEFIAHFIGDLLAGDFHGNALPAPAGGGDSDEA